MCILCPSAVHAQGGPPEPGTAVTTRVVDGSLPQTLILRNAIAREVARLALPPGSALSLQAQRPVARERTWVRRYPARFGALVGAGAGAVSSVPRWTEMYCAGGGDEDCLFHGGAGVLFGAGAGAGIGALIGFVAGR